MQRFHVLCPDLPPTPLRRGSDKNLFGSSTSDDCGKTKAGAPRIGWNSSNES